MQKTGPRDLPCVVFSLSFHREQPSLSGSKLGLTRSPLLSAPGLLQALPVCVYSSTSLFVTSPPHVEQ